MPVLIIMYCMKDMMCCQDERQDCGSDGDDNTMQGGRRGELLSTGGDGNASV